MTVRPKALREMDRRLLAGIRRLEQNPEANSVTKDIRTLSTINLMRELLDVTEQYDEALGKAVPLREYLRQLYLEADRRIAEMKDTAS